MTFCSQYVQSWSSIGTVGRECLLASICNLCELTRNRIIARWCFLFWIHRRWIPFIFGYRLSSMKIWLCLSVSPLVSYSHTIFVCVWPNRRSIPLTRDMILMISIQIKTIYNQCLCQNIFLPTSFIHCINFFYYFLFEISFKYSLLHPSYRSNSSITKSNLHSTRRP